MAEREHVYEYWIKPREIWEALQKCGYDLPDWGRDLLAEEVRVSQAYGEPVVVFRGHTTAFKGIGKK